MENVLLNSDIAGSRACCAIFLARSKSQGRGGRSEGCCCLVSALSALLHRVGSASPLLLQPKPPSPAWCPPWLAFRAGLTDTERVDLGGGPEVGGHTVALRYPK